MANRRGKGGSSDRLPLLGLYNHCGWWLQPWNQKAFASWQESYDKPNSVLKSRDIILLTKLCLRQGYVFPVVTYGYERWTIKAVDHRLQTVVLEKTPESPLGSKEIKPANLEGSQPWIVIGKTDGKDETPVFWASDANSWLIGKAPDAGKDWRQKEKRASEDKMAGWHHWCNGHELGQTSGDGEGQRGLACCRSWGCKDSDTTRWLDNNNNME